MGPLPLIFGLLGHLVSIYWTAEGAIISNKELSGHESCTDYGEAFERVFANLGKLALLRCTLDIEKLFNSANTSYNITWYNQKTGSEIAEAENSIILRETSLWFINITMEHQGNYICVVRTGKDCYKQEVVVVVEDMTSENCTNSNVWPQFIRKGVVDFLACPLKSYFKSVDSYTIQWYKKCQELHEDQKFLVNNEVLMIRNVHSDDAGLYTCKMIFRLGDISSEMVETIECLVKDDYLKTPQLLEPINEIIRVNRGSSFSKQCRVLIPGKGFHTVSVLWTHFVDSDETLVFFNTSERIHQILSESEVEGGILVVSTLRVSEVLEGDFNLNFTCSLSSTRGGLFGQFTLLPADPNYLLPLGVLLGMVALLFMIGVLLYKIFKVELTLWFRNMFPFLYKTTDGDGKMYDAYIAYPRILEGSSEMAEIFALRTLPQVLENQYGYKLFILGRDSLPGEAVVDVVQDALNRCRRLLLLYTSSSLCSPEALEWVEQQMGLHRALVENTMRIVLLEMEEIRDPMRLPESMRLLKKRQGALQAWKRRKRWTSWDIIGWRRSEKDRQTEDSMTSLNPSARFWREVRYHMPVRGKAKSRNVLFSF